jgi:hypothetical protein
MGKFTAGRPFLFLLLLLVLQVSSENEDTCINDATCSANQVGENEKHGNKKEDQDDPTMRPPRVSDSCQLVMAESSLPNAGWGVFSMVDRKKGSAVLEGDIVIQITDLNPLHTRGMNRLAKNNYYLWDGQETGGQYEGSHVLSAIPGIGMLANGHTQHRNILPFAPRVDEGGLTRQESFGAGAISHYHNYTWYISKDVHAGDELFADYEYTSEIAGDEQAAAETPISEKKTPTPSWLRENGYCLDNLYPGKSRIEAAGRGAFAGRDLEKGSVVAPVPVLSLSSSSLEMERNLDNEQGVVHTQQLLRNYCFGHVNSSLLLYPYSPMINLINHYTEPNVKLQWVKKKSGSIESLQDNNDKESPQLLLELIAVRPIQQGEEIYLDYGSDWERAWWTHIKSWKPAGEHYIPSYVVDDATRLLRTEAEQKEHPYQDNVFTSCFYRYSDRTSEEKQQQISKNDAITTFRWNLFKGLYDLKNLRPCQVVRRNEDQKGRTGYAVRIMNRPGLDEKEVIPKGRLHIVTHVPRSAFRFSDKLYTTDQHLENAFRKEIGLGDIFPSEWMDLVEELE